MKYIYIIIVNTLIVLGCAESDDLRVTLDPESRILRTDLKELASSPCTKKLRSTFSWSARRVPIMNRSARGNVRASALINLNINPKKRSLTGCAKLTLKPQTQPLMSAEFYLDALEKPKVESPDFAVTYEYKEHVLSISPYEPIKVGQTWLLVIKWYHENVELIVDDFPEGGGRVMANLIDEKSTFFTYGYFFWPQLITTTNYTDLSFVVTYPYNYQLFTSGTLLGCQNNEDSTKSCTWSVEHPYTNRVSLALAKYKPKVCASCGNANVEIYAIDKKHSIDDYPLCPEIYAPIIESFCKDYCKRFGELAFETIRLVGVDPRFANGYSTPGLILLPNYVWDDDGLGSFLERDFFLSSALSHQWWGNDATCKTKRDIWLVQGMADYLAGTCITNTQGEDAGKWIWLWEVQELLDYYKNGGYDHPVVPEDTSNMDPHIYYIKGAWVLRMLETIIGKEDMEEILRIFWTHHHFTTFTTEEFIELADKISGKDLSYFFEQWLSGTGIVSLGQSSTVQQNQIDVSVSQKNAWSYNPEQYFSLPLTIRAEKKGEFSVEQTFFLDKKDCVFSIPFSK